MEITIEMNLNDNIIARNGYTILDVFSDVGGIQGLFISFAAAFLGVANFQNFDNYLASRLFKVVKKEPDQSLAQAHLNHEKLSNSQEKRADPIRVTKCCNSLYYLLSCIPDCLRCKCKCCQSPNSKGLKKALKVMDQETNIVEIVRARRYFRMALRVLLTNEVRSKLK